MRPPKYEPEYCEELIKTMSEGFSIEGFAGKIGVSKQTIYNWATTYPEFAEAKAVGEMKARLWFEQIGHAGMTGQLRRVSKETLDGNGNVIHREYEQATFVPAVWIFTGKNRFGWRDHANITLRKDDDEPKTISELAFELYEQGRNSEPDEVAKQIPERLPLPNRIRPGGKDVTPEADRVVQPSVET
jgi:transposase-like protein